MIDFSGPVLILQRRILGGDCIGIDAVTPYARLITCVVPFSGSTDKEIDAALRESWKLQADSDDAAACALVSRMKDEADDYALDDPDPDPTVG